jgi:uncharacterized protein (DUF488 family)
MMNFFTIGYGGRRPEDFTALLVKNNVKVVADVRLRPDHASMGVYVKVKSPDKGIQKLLSDAGIAYHSLPELGNVFLDCQDWRERYKQLLEKAGDLLTMRLVNLPGPICLLCAEKQATDCHRHLIAGYLASRGWEPKHIA